MSDALESFLEWFLQKTPCIGAVPLNGAVSHIEGVTRVLWFRQPPFQVELFIAPPNYIIPEHKHPHVDRFEVYVGGQISFSHGGKFVTRWESDGANDLGFSLHRGMVIRVHPTDLHGGAFGPAGGVFFSVQHWLNNVQPHCVAADYTGTVMGRDHAAKVVFGDAVLKESLSAQDVASAENWSVSEENRQEAGSHLDIKRAEIICQSTPLLAAAPA